MRIETLFLTIMLMFVGASPGSTGGGIKTATFAIVIMRLCATMRGMRDTVIFKRRVSMDVVSKSFLIRSKYGVNLIAIRRRVDEKDVWNVNPMATDIRNEGDILVVVGLNENLGRLGMEG